MDLSREQPNDPPDAEVRAAQETPGRRGAPAHAPRDRIILHPDATTPALRRCTALAARARVELLQRRQDSADELISVLDEITRWEDASLIAPDPTMLALSAAALQDLRERLAEHTEAELTARVDAVLTVLRDALERAPLGSTA